jgi:hypothetical protein
MDSNQKSATKHEIAYAYPTSPSATKLGFGKQGCYIFTTIGKDHPLATIGEAYAAAKAAGTTPGRWSIDHPCNQTMSALNG